MRRILKAVAVIALLTVFGISVPKPVKALLPSTQAELDKSNAAVQKTIEDTKKAYDYMDACKVILDQAIASGDSIAISRADAEYKRAQTLVDWNIDQYFNALAYQDHARNNAAAETRKADYTNFLIKRGEYDVAAAAYTEAQNQLKTAQDKLAYFQKNINDLTVALPTHPELQATLNAQTAELPALQADIAVKAANVNATKVVFDQKTEELKAFNNVYWTYGEHEVYTQYIYPYRPTEKWW
ncbi:MAG: hypothetical protein K6D90_04420 [Lachnospiraceae bacterium]|nr:hypothetical protein [Lachnospiraceae bacterium]